MTARDLTSGMLTAISAAVFRPAILVEIDLYASGSPDTQYLRLWTGVGSLSWDGKTWTGAGKLLSFTPIEESADIRAIGFEVQFSGLTSGDAALALQTGRQGRTGRIWLAGLDATGAVIADPYQLTGGRFDTFLLNDDGKIATVGARYEGALIDLERPRERRYTHEDQQIDYPGDLGFEFVNALQDMQLIWGGPGAAASPVAQPSGGGADNGGVSGTD